MIHYFYFTSFILLFVVSVSFLVFMILAFMMMDENGEEAKVKQDLNWNKYSQNDNYNEWWGDN